MHRFLPLLLALMLAVAACGGEDPSLAPEDIDIDLDEPTDTETDAETDTEPAEGDYDVSEQPADAAATFTTPADGDTVSSPVAFEMTATGVEIVPADEPAVGEAHFHISVDAGCIPEGEPVPGPGEDAEAEGHFHFGDGSSEAELPLEPGSHELCLQLADGAHTAFGESDEITITVE